MGYYVKMMHALEELRKESYGDHMSGIMDSISKVTPILREIDNQIMDMRRSLCVAIFGTTKPYFDDGEMQVQDEGIMFDFKRDSWEDIKKKLDQRAKKMTEGKPFRVSERIVINGEFLSFGENEDNAIDNVEDRLEKKFKEMGAIDVKFECVDSREGMF